MATNNEIDFQEGFDVEEISPGRVKVSLDLTEVQNLIGNIDGGNAGSTYGGTTGIDGGTS